MKPVNHLPARVAAIQLCSGANLEENWAAAAGQLRAASHAGAQLAVLPENFAMFAADQYPATALQLSHLLERLGALARELNLWIVAGTLPAAQRDTGEPVPDGRVRTACHVINAQGIVAARYDKIHLFDVEVADAQGSYRESATFEPGNRVVCVDTPVGRLGLTVCYDLRFPELFRALADQGAEWVSVPAAFTQLTGAAHWQVLLRARAIENQLYVIGAAQGGTHSATRRTFGHSQIIDPWGRVLAECGDEIENTAAFICADGDKNEQVSLQNRMPVRTHRRLR